MSAALTVRLPDLWLKRAMAMKFLPVGTQAAQVQNAWFVRCVKGSDGRDALFSQWLGGDTAIRVSDDLNFLAGTLELLLLNGNTEEIDHAAVKKHLMGRQTPILKDGLLGTFGDFAVCMDRILQERSDYAEIGGLAYIQRQLSAVVRNALLDTLDESIQPSGPIQIWHGKTRDWAASVGAGEKIVRQPMNKRQETIAQGDFVQFVVPPMLGNRFVCGFELKLGDDLVSSPWCDVGSWFGARAQSSDKATLLFDEPVNDEDAAFVDVKGEFAARLVSIESDQLGEFRGIFDQEELIDSAKGLTNGCPEDWPTGYAKSIALVTYAKRAADRIKRMHNKNERDAKLANEGVGQEANADNVPSMPLLYRADYLVI